MDKFKNNFFSPKDFLKNTSLTQSKEYQKYRFLNHWSSIIGKTISLHTNLIVFKGGILYIEVNDPMWKTELTLNKQFLIKKINSLFPATELKEIVFSYAPFKTKKEPVKNSGDSVYVNFNSSNETTKKELKKELDSLPQDISPELKESLAKLKLTWNKVRKNPPKNIFSNQSDTVNLIKLQNSNIQFTNYYFPLNSIRSEFLNFNRRKK